MAYKSADAIRKDITEKIVNAIKQGTIPWRKPWQNDMINSGLPANFQSKRRYTGINSLILGLVALQNNWSSKFWGTSSSVLKTIGAHVKKGETATYVTFFKMIPIKDENGNVEKNSKGEEKKIPILREYPVFHIEQFQAPTVETLLDGRGKYGIVKALLGQFDKKDRRSVTTIAELRKIAEKHLPRKDQPKKSATREEIAQAIHVGIEAKLKSYFSVAPDVNIDPDFTPAEELLNASRAKITFGGNRACYRHPPHDDIRLPHKKTFESMSHFYQTAFHELAHWTMPDSRVGRVHKFDDSKENYAFEELVAELSSCFLLTEVGVPMAEEMLPNSQSYLASWVKCMENDPKYIFLASSQASKVVDYLLGFVGKQNPEYEDDESGMDTDENAREVA